MGRSRILAVPSSTNWPLPAAATAAVSGLQSEKEDCVYIEY